jgi:predicted nucleic acid-binding protein
VVLRRRAFESCPRTPTDDVQHVAPDFILTEFASTGVKRVRRGDVGEDDVRQASTRLPAMLFLHATPPLVPGALELALLFERSVYDSLYVCLASLLNYQLVTADRRLYNALASAFAQTMLWIEDIPPE